MFQVCKQGVTAAAWFRYNEEKREIISHSFIIVSKKFSRITFLTLF